MTFNWKAYENKDKLREVLNEQGFSKRNTNLVCNVWWTQHKQKEEEEEKQKRAQARLNVLSELFEKKNIEETSHSLILENQTLKEERKQKLLIDSGLDSELARENEVLKNQLKKYVAAVQLIRSDGSTASPDAQEALSGLRATDSNPIPPPMKRSKSETDSIYEEKLVQMAEMHAELLELNEGLQRQMVERDNRIARMRQELISLRGPLPEETSSQGSSSDTSPRPSSSRPLINIWIPSVFLKGKGTDAYHLYQIYIRVGDDEWNIYRRFSQFDKLNTQTTKVLPLLAKYNFPKKKVFGKKVKMSRIDSRDGEYVKSDSISALKVFEATHSYRP
jgi:hypothetical protein